LLKQGREVIHEVVMADLNNSFYWISDEAMTTYQTCALNIGIENQSQLMGIEVITIHIRLKVKNTQEPNTYKFFLSFTKETHFFKRNKQNTKHLI